MRLFPIIFSMNYVCYEIVPEVRAALEEAGFYVYEASCVNPDGSYINNLEKFLLEIKHYIDAAVHMRNLEPTLEVAVLVHYDNPSIFLDKRLQKLVGEDEPFINYVDAATNETSVCMFRDGKMECLYQSDNMPPYSMLGHGYLCANEDHNMHIVPANYNHAFINDAIFSVRERWFEVLRVDGNSASYLRTYLNPKDKSTVRKLYEALCMEGVWKCHQISEEHLAGRFTDDVSTALSNAGNLLRTYDCYEILGTNIFLLISDGKYSSLLVSLSSTDEQMNKFLDSDLYRMLVESKK